MRDPEDIYILEEEAVIMTMVMGMSTNMATKNKKRRRKQLRQWQREMKNISHLSKRATITTMMVHVTMTMGMGIVTNTRRNQGKILISMLLTSMFWVIC